MKKLYPLLSVLFLIYWGCSKPIDKTTLIEKNGLMYLPNSDVPYSGLYTGWYENGQKSYKVTYKDGNLSGEWTYYHRDGTKIEPIVFDNVIIYKENIFFNKDTDIPYSGRVLTVHENGQKEWEVTYKDGKEDGLVTQWYENGKKQLEVTFKDGGPDGLWTLWYENGKKKEEKTFKDGEEISKKEWNEDGSVKQ